jgi:hypothetical protein
MDGSRVRSPHRRVRLLEFWAEDFVEFGDFGFRKGLVRRGLKNVGLTGLDWLKAARTE